ncbi:MAG: UbiA family prenyltransferase [Candidatus Thermoplasmatota archaeon]
MIQLGLEKAKSFGEKNTVLFLVSYLLFVSSLDCGLKVLLGNDLNLSLSYFYLNTLVFAILFFLLLGIIHSFSDNKSISRSILNLSSIFWLFALAPIITVIFDGTISYLNMMDWSRTLEVLSIGTEMNVGLMIIYPIIFLIGIQIGRYLETSLLKKSAYSISGAILSFMAFVVVFSQLNITWIEGTEFSSFAFHQDLALLFLLFFIQLSVVVSIILSLWKRNLFKNYVSNMKIFRSLHFAVMTIIGFVVLYRLDHNTFTFTDRMNIPILVLAPLCMILTWQFTAMINDIFDKGIDKVVHPDRPLVTGEIDLSTYRNTAITFAFLSLLISLYFGVLLTLLNMTFIIAALLYSIPPVRLKERAYGYICVGYASVIALLFGIYSPIAWSVSIEEGRLFLLEGLPFFDDVLPISLIIFLALSISPYINALSDYEGDKRSGVKNIYTIYGRDKGKKIMTVLIVVLFLSPIALLQGTLDLIIIIPISLIAAYVFYVHEDHRPIFGMYFLVILYSIIRYIGYL